MDGNIKSLEYLEDIKNYLTNDKDLIEVLEKIGYILTDNGYSDARWLLDDIIDMME